MVVPIHTDQNRRLGFLLSFGFILILGVSSLFAQGKNKAYMIETFSSSDFSDLIAKTSGGHIELIGGNSDKIEVQVFVKKGSKFLSSSNYDLEDDFELNIEKEGSTVRAEAKSKKENWSGMWKKRPSISYKILLPRSANAELRTSGGHIDVSMIEGNITMRTSGGHLTVKEFSGVLEGRTSGGHINLELVEGDVNVRTSGGHINLTEVNGNYEVRTSGGHINVDELYGSVTGRTSGGNLNVKVDQLVGAIDLRTSGGNVNLEMPSSSAANLDISASRVRGNLKNFTGNQSKKKIEGSINGGGIDVKLRTSGGVADIKLN